MVDIYADAAPRLKMTRNALGLTQENMAEIIGVTQPAYGQWERGLRKIDMRLLIKLCDRYGLTLDWFYRGQLRYVEHELATKIELLMDKASTR